MEHYRKIIWEDIRVERDTYQIDYQPVNLKSENFAKVWIYLNKQIGFDEIEKILENELDYWTDRFPISAMAFILDQNGELIDLAKTNSENCLTRFLDADDDSFKTQWGAIDHTKMKEFTDSELAEIYKDSPHKTRLEKEIERDQKILKTRKQKRFSDFTFLIWLLATICIAYLGWQNYFVGGVAFFYALFKTIIKLFSFFGISTSLFKKKKDKERKMQHYYYHCEKNPEGFRRLVAENIQKNRL